LVQVVVEDIFEIGHGEGILRQSCYNGLFSCVEERIHQRDEQGKVHQPENGIENDINYVLRNVVVIGF
jgi:hypothetical protein